MLGSAVGGFERVLIFTGTNSTPQLAPKSKSRQKQSG